MEKASARPGKQQRKVPRRPVPAPSADAELGRLLSEALRRAKAVAADDPGVVPIVQVLAALQSTYAASAAAPAVIGPLATGARTVLKNGKAAVETVRPRLPAVVNDASFGAFMSEWLRVSNDAPGLLERGVAERLVPRKPREAAKEALDLVQGDTADAAARSEVAERIGEFYLVNTAGVGADAVARYLTLDEELTTEGRSAVHKAVAWPSAKVRPTEPERIVQAVFVALGCKDRDLFAAGRNRASNGRRRKKRQNLESD